MDCARTLWDDDRCVVGDTEARRLLYFLSRGSRVAADLIDGMRCLLDRERLRRVELQLDTHARRTHEVDVDTLIELAAPGIAELLDAVALLGQCGHRLRHHRAVVCIGAGQRVAQDIADAKDLVDRMKHKMVMRDRFLAKKAAKMAALQQKKTDKD